MLCQVIEVDRDKDLDGWMDARSAGIGGSDAASIFGEGYTSAYTLWAQKSGMVPREQVENEAMQWGHDLERPVAQRTAREYGMALVRWPVMFRNVAHPVMLANVDFWVVNPSPEFPVGVITEWEGMEPPPGLQCILETKTTGIATYGNADAWADDGVPTQYERQGIHYCAVTGFQHVVFAALVGGHGLVVRGREYSDEDILRHIEGVHKFWQHVVTGTPPEPDGEDNTMDTVRTLFPHSKPNVIVEADDATAEVFQQYVKAKDAVARATTDAQALKVKLAIAIGEGEEMVYNGRSLFTYKSSKDTVKFKADEFRVQYPGLYNNFCVPVPGTRSLRMKGEK